MCVPISLRLDSHSSRSLFIFCADVHRHRSCNRERKNLQHAESARCCWRPYAFSATCTGFVIHTKCCASVVVPLMLVRIFAKRNVCVVRRRRRRRRRVNHKFENKRPSRRSRPPFFQKFFTHFLIVGDRNFVGLNLE